MQMPALDGIFPFLLTQCYFLAGNQSPFGRNMHDCGIHANLASKICQCGFSQLPTVLAPPQREEGEEGKRGRKRRESFSLATFL